MDFTTLSPLLWLLVLIGVGTGFYHSLVDRPSGLRTASFALRVLGIILLVLALCQPFAGEKGDDAHVVFLVDVSQSVDLPAAKDALNQVDAGIKALRKRDSYSLLSLIHI